MKKTFLTLCLVLIATAGFPAEERYDIVLRGGRVMDPETGLDAVRNVGIRDDRILEISEEALEGDDVIDVSGLVVAPGFIDLHAHGQTNAANEYQAHDGVTTALELESGVPSLKAWIKKRQGKAFINFGASFSHGLTRWTAMARYAELAKRVRAGGELGQERPAFDTRYEALRPEELDTLVETLSTGLSEGALGIGVAVGYYPGASRQEIFRVYAFAAKMGVPIFTHVRAPDIASIQEALADGAATGASVHVVHVNSMALGRIGAALEMIGAAQEQGIDITTELYPYTAASTSLESTLFDEGWKDVMGIDYQDLQWEKTGERLTKETFDRYRKEGGTVIIHMMKEPWIEEGLRAPFTMVGSDGMPYAPLAHPRSAGTFSRVLGRYVREKKVLSLMDALRKMTIMPARRLDAVAPGMRLKGRLQIGCDADITVFDPETVIDTATFGKPLSFAKGIPHVMVNGTFVVRNGKTVDDVFPGRPVLGKYRN